MSRLHLFIGHHKTGSTSLQHYLATNIGQLAKNGILYPHVDMLSILRARESQSSLADSKDSSKLNARIKALGQTKNYIEPHNALAFRMLSDATGCPMPNWHQGTPTSSQVMLDLIREQIEDREPEDILLISEVLGNFGASGKGLCEKLISQLETNERYLTCILRRPDDYIVSWYGQELCFGYKKMGSLQQRLRNTYINSIHIRYDWMLTDWIEKGNLARLCIEDYRNVLLAGGTISWMIERLQAETDAKLAEEQMHVWANTSLHPALFNPVRHCNHVLTRKESAGLVELLKQEISTLSLPPAARVEALGIEARELIYRLWVPINKVLGGFVGRPEFFGDLESILDLREYRSEEIERNAVNNILYKLGDAISAAQREALADWLSDDKTSRL